MKNYTLKQHKLNHEKNSNSDIKTENTKKNIFNLVIIFLI